MNYLNMIIDAIGYVAIITFLVYVLIASIRHTGPDERNARTRYNFNDEPCLPPKPDDTSKS